MDNKRNDNKNNDLPGRSARRSRPNEGSAQRRSSRTGDNTSSRKAKDDLLFPQNMRAHYSEDGPVNNGVYTDNDTDTESIADIMIPRAAHTSKSNKAPRAVRSSSASSDTHGTHIHGSHFENQSVRINSDVDTEPIIQSTNNTKDNSHSYAAFNSSSSIRRDYSAETNSVSESGFDSDIDSNRSSDRGLESKSDSSSRRRRNSGTYYRDNIIQDDGRSTHGKRKSKQDDLSANSISAGGFSRESHKKQANIKELIKIFSVLMVILVVIIGAIIFYQKLHVSTISVIGSRKYSEKQLISKSGIQDGAFILSYSDEDIYALFGKIDDISVTEFRRIYPDKLEIRVVDRDARAAIPAGNGKYTIISADGYVIGSNAESSEGLIVIRGLAGKSYAVGNCIDDDTQSASELAIIELLEGVNESELSSVVTAIDLSNTSCIKFEIGDKFTIVLGDCIEASQNIETASKAYAIFSRSYPEGGVINVFTNSTIADFTPARPADADTDEP